jgi:hypothetical protein
MYVGIVRRTYRSMIARPPNLHNIFPVTLDEHEMFGRYLILDNAVIHKIAAVQELIFPGSS